MAGFVALTPGTVFAGDFRIDRPLAEGGMGAVYVAEQLSTGRLRALKVMHPTLAPDERSRERFAEEARVGSRIESEHVVDVITAGIDPQTEMPWLCMELLEGRDLHAHIEAHGPMAPAQALEVLEQLLHALADAHAKGIVHRDLKPENVFLARRKGAREEDVVKILDFGIARMIEGSRTSATVTSAIGSPLWMAPEQAQSGAKLRPSTDVWALGLITFYLLTGRSFWRAANEPEFNLSALLVEMVTQAIPAASERARELGVEQPPPGLDAWFARCVNREPERRFPSAAEALAELPAALAVGARRRAAAADVPSSRVSPTAVMSSSGGTMQVSPPRRPLAVPLLVGGAAVGVLLVAGVVVALSVSGEDPVPPASSEPTPRGRDDGSPPGGGQGREQPEVAAEGSTEGPFAGTWRQGPAVTEVEARRWVGTVCGRRPEPEIDPRGETFPIAQEGDELTFRLPGVSPPPTTSSCWDTDDGLRPVSVNHDEGEWRISCLTEDPSVTTRYHIQAEAEDVLRFEGVRTIVRRGSRCVATVTTTQWFFRANGTPVTIRTDTEGATLVADGQPRGPLVDGMTLELPAGAHTLEARLDDVTLAERTMTVPANGIVETTLRIPERVEPEPEPRPRRVRRTRRPPPAPEPRPFGGGSRGSGRTSGTSGTSGTTPLPNPF